MAVPLLSETFDSLSARDVTTFIAGAATLAAIRIAFAIASSPDPKIIRAPARETGKDSDHPTTYYPGERDIDTPYGSIRAYEFGPEDGEKVLFIHGITTPCAVFTGILPKMVEAGYRVCTYDLFGRGYSDSPDLKHDDRLYVTQILCVLQTIGWTKCSVVGYSLGGCLASSFASYFADSVDKLILIAPAGLLAQRDISFGRRLAMSESVPFGVVSALQTLVVPKVKEIANDVTGGRVDVTHVSAWQTDKHRGFPRSCESPFRTSHETLLDFVLMFPSDLSSFRFAPIFDQWDLFARLRSKNLDVHAIWGDADDIVDTELVSANLKRAMPDISLTIIDGVAHDICTSKPNEVAAKILTILQG